MKKVKAVLAKALSSSFQPLPVGCLRPDVQPSHPLAASPAHPVHGSITFTSCMPAFGELTGPLRTQQMWILKPLHAEQGANGTYLLHEWMPTHEVTAERGGSLPP